MVYERMYSFGEGSNYFLSMRIGYLLKQKEQADGVRKIQRQTLTDNGYIDGLEVLGENRFAIDLPWGTEEIEPLASVISIWA